MPSLLHFWHATPTAIDALIARVDAPVVDRGIDLALRQYRADRLEQLLWESAHGDDEAFSAALQDALEDDERTPLGVRAAGVLQRLEFRRCLPSLAPALASMIYRSIKAAEAVPASADAPFESTAAPDLPGARSATSMFNLNVRMNDKRATLAGLGTQYGFGNHRGDGPAAAQAAKTGAAPADLADELDDAQSRAVEQRKAAEALLEEARTLEERLTAEATAARSARERLAAQRAIERWEHAAQLAQEAEGEAEARTAAHDRIVAELRDAEARLAERRAAAHRARETVTARQREAEAAAGVLAQALEELQALEARLAECASSEVPLQQQAVQAEERLARYRAARDAAAGEAAAAGDRLQSMAATSVGATPTADTRDALDALADRLTALRGVHVAAARTAS